MRARFSSFDGVVASRALMSIVAQPKFATGSALRPSAPGFPSVRTSCGGRKSKEVKGLERAQSTCKKKKKIAYYKGKITLWVDNRKCSRAIIRLLNDGSTV